MIQPVNTSQRASGQIQGRLYFLSLAFLGCFTRNTVRLGDHPRMLQTHRPTFYRGHFRPGPPDGDKTGRPVLLVTGQQGPRPTGPLGSSGLSSPGPPGPPTCPPKHREIKNSESGVVRAPSSASADATLPGTETWCCGLTSKNPSAFAESKE